MYSSERPRASEQGKRRMSEPRGQEGVGIAEKGRESGERNRERRTQGHGERQRELDRGLECRQATLHLLLPPRDNPPPRTQPRSLPPTTHSLSLSLVVPRLLPLCLRPCTPLLLLQIYKLSHPVIELLRPRRGPRWLKAAMSRAGKFDGIGRLIPLQRKAPADFHL